MKLSSTLLILSLGIFAVMASPVDKDPKRLIKTSEKDPGIWMTPDEVIQLRLSGNTFVDITNDRDFSLERNLPHIAGTELRRIDDFSIPTNPRFQTVVTDLIRTANRTRVENFVRDYTVFFNRYYQSESGEQSQKWLTSQVQASLADYRGSSSVREVDQSWRQKTIVARIEGSHPQLKNEIVIIGGHEDSIAGGADLPAPGADDNASGSSVVLETLRILSAAGIRPNRTIEFHWYAAEEIGLLGSAALAAEYKSNNVTVVGMLNMDTVSYNPNNITNIGVFTDNGNAQLVQFVRDLVDEYLSFGRIEKSCGYACSDHASWTRNDYPAMFAAEGEGNPNAHTTGDVYATVDFNQIMEFVKLAVGFAIELSFEN